MTALQPEIFWGSINIESQSETKMLMMNQALSLGNITKNLVEADVTTTINGEEADGFVDAPTYSHCFDIIAPLLNYQRFTLFCVTQIVGVEYPLNLYSNYWGEKKTCKCATMDDFKQCLKQILSSEKTGELINSIIAQSR